MSLTPEQRAQILYLYRVEGVSTVLIAVMMGLSRTAVSRVVRQASGQDAPAQQKAAAMRPSSKGRIERQDRFVRADLLRRGTS